MKTIIDKTTGKVLYATILDFSDNETEIGVDELVTENFVKPYFDFENKKFYEGATKEEIEQSQIVEPVDIQTRITQLENELAEIKASL